MTIDRVLENGLWKITITTGACGGDMIVDIRGDAGDVISFIECINNSGSNRSLILFVGPASTGTGISFVGGIRTPDSPSHPVVLAELITTGNVNALQVTDYSTTNLIVGGNLSTEICCVERTDGAPSQLAGLTIGGSIFGDVVNAYGDIGPIVVQGNFGNISTGIPARAWSKGSIRHLDAPNGYIYAEIDANKYNSNGTSDIGRIRAKSGVFGNINARQFADIAGAQNPPGLFATEGDLDATVTLTGALDREIIIGKSLTSTASISVPSIAPGGQITINNLGASHTWSGAVTVNGSALTNPPYYTNLASSIGGGSVGLATFALHRQSCDPPHDSAFAIRSVVATGPGGTGNGECVTNQLDIRLRFYGPITLHEPTVSEDDSPPFYVWKYIGGVQQWEKVDWPVIATVDTLADPGGRVMRIQSDWETLPSTGLYRITRNGNRMTCKGVGAGTEPAVAEFEYHITLIDECALGLLAMFDLNTDQSVNGGDIGAWAATPVDFNADSATDSADLAILVNAINTFSSLPN
ncbi:MAG: hypothetical protein AB7R63_04125 [Phycisphaerales bacterium]